MTTYTVTYRSATRWAEQTIRARTPQAALAKARKAFADDPLSLDWETYEHDGQEWLEEMTISNDRGAELASWLSEDCYLSLAARGLLDALEAQTAKAQAVIGAWEMGDLAGAVRMLDGSIAEARAAIAKAKPPTR